MCKRINYLVLLFFKRAGSWNSSMVGRHIQAKLIYKVFLFIYLFILVFFSIVFPRYWSEQSVQTDCRRFPFRSGLFCVSLTCHCWSFQNILIIRGEAKTNIQNDGGSTNYYGPQDVGPLERRLAK